MFEICLNSNQALQSAHNKLSRLATVCPLLLYNWCWRNLRTHVDQLPCVILFDLFLTMIFTKVGVVYQLYRLEVHFVHSSSDAVGAWISNLLENRFLWFTMVFKGSPWKSMVVLGFHGFHGFSWISSVHWLL